MLQASERGVAVLLNCGESADSLLARFATLTELDRSAAADSRGARLDLRTYGVGAQILRDLGVARMLLMALPLRLPSMAGFDLEVAGHLEPGQVPGVTIR
jgi:3,4-dihydroxy 2-butanone 4-phosphate synthase/GTP cyclohydrolase II